MNSFYTEDELKNIGLKRYGANVLISRFANIYSPETIEVGDNVRIDDFCILSGNIKIANNVHISVGCYLFAGDVGIEIDDYSGISSRSAVYAISDDYSGDFLTNPTVLSKYRNIINSKVTLKKYSIVGSGSTILPGSIIEEGVAIGAMSLVKGKTEPWSIYCGIPCKKIKERSKKLLELI